MTRAPTIADQRAAQAQLAAQGVHEVEEWGEWRRGDVVGCTTAAGAFTIVSFRVDPDTNQCRWVNVIGGARGDQMCRSFLPSKLVRKPRKRKRKS